MRKVRCTRGPSTEQGTFGVWALLGEDGAPDRRWVSLELPWHGNQRGVSCVKADTLRGRLVDSPHFKRKVYAFENKNGRESVELHTLNFAGDALAGWKIQAHGCVGIGQRTGSLDTGEGFSQEAVLASGKALDEFIEATGGEEIEVEFVWSAGNEPEDGRNPEEHSIARPALQAS